MFLYNIQSTPDVKLVDAGSFEANQAKQNVSNFLGGDLFFLPSSLYFYGFHHFLILWTGFLLGEGDCLA